MDGFVSPWILEHTSDVTAFHWLVVRTLGFVLLLGLVVRFIVPVIAAMLQHREQAVAEAAVRLRDTLAETRQLRDDYRDRLERIHDEAEVRLAEAVRESEELRDAIEAEARRTSDALFERTRADIERERDKSFEHLRIEFADDVIEAARFAASRTLTPERQSALVGEFVRELGERT